MVWTIVACVLVVVLLITALLSKFVSSKRNLIVDVKTNESITECVPFFESMRSRLTSKLSAQQRMYNFAKRFNYSNFQHFFGPFCIYTINNAQDAKRVFLNWRDFPKMTLNSEVIRLLAGENLVFVNADTWKRQHNIIAPTFVNIDRFAETFVRQIEKCIRGFESYSVESQEDINIPLVQFNTAFTLDVLGLSVFGYDFELLAEVSKAERAVQTNSEFVTALKFLLGELSNFVAFLVPFYSKLPLQRNKNVSTALAKIDEMVKMLIDKAKEKRNEKEETLLDLMLASTDEETGNKLSDKELRDNIVIFFIAGHDTTSTALSFAMWRLAKHKDIQQRLIEEIDNALGTNDEAIDIEKVKNLEYLGWVIKETLRMHPPVSNLPLRQVNKSYEVFGNHKVKKGCSISISIFNIHHNEEYWSDPFEFRPERFSEEESKKRPLYAFLPFGGGARVCLGNNFSLLEQRLYLVSILRKYTFELPQDETTELKLTNVGIGLAMPDPSTRFILKRR